MSPRSFQTSLCLLAISLASCLPIAIAYAQDTEPLSWPRQIDAKEGKLVIYQPQLEALEGDLLTGRAAVSATPNGKDSPIFGAVWFECILDIDRETRLAEIQEIKIPRVKIADFTEENQELFSDIVERELNGRSLTLSYDRLLASLDAVESKRKIAEGLNNDPPEIIIEYQPAILVLCDGDPQLRATNESNVMRVINSPFFVAFEQRSKSYWLFGGTEWFTAKNPKDEWKVDSRPPADVVAVQHQELASAGADPDAKPEEPEDTRTPKIVFATVPTELIVIDGEPSFSPIADNSLLYISNTENDVFMNVDTQQYYISLSGRWYRNSKLSNDNWEYIRSDNLPEAFAAIPADSEKGQVRVFVAGTDEADEALIDAQMPQTAAIDRKTASVEVTYDGKPQFKKIPNTSISYAVNSPKDVLQIGDAYYVCDNAVWFTGPSAKGPWTVADSVPEEIQDIPPESPVHNVSYVRIYDSTPDVVYVGYMPGYMGCYPYYGSVVYGTGFYYSPWIGSTCYPRHSTWGFCVNYNPWTGWSFGMSWSVGWASFSYGFGTHNAGWWGPGGYRWRPNNNYINNNITINRPININTGDINIGNRINAGNKIGNRNSINNLYQNKGNRDRLSQRDTGRRFQDARSQQGISPLKSTNLPNDVFADRSGNIMQRTDKGDWRQRDQGNWSQFDRSNLNQNRSNRDFSSLNREHASRMRGTTRAQSLGGRAPMNRGGQMRRR